MLIFAGEQIENMPTRFKYTEVPAESYGLTAADVLNLTDKELNAYVSLKKLAPYRQDGSSNTKKKAQDKKLRDLKRATGQRGWGDALPQSRAKQVDLSKYSASSGDKKRKRDHESTLNGDGLSTEGAAGGGKKKRMGKKERQRAKSAAEPVE